MTIKLRFLPEVRREQEPASWAIVHQAPLNVKKKISPHIKAYRKGQYVRPGRVATVEDLRRGPVVTVQTHGEYNYD